MAESFNPSSFIKNLLLEIPGEIVAIPIAMEILQWFTGRKKKHGENDTLLVDVRAQLLADLYPEGKNPYPKIWARHKQASLVNEENCFVLLLAKIPHEPVNLRKVLFPVLNDLNDDQFNQALELLEHDALIQFLKRMAPHASSSFKKAWHIVELVLVEAEKRKIKLEGWLSSVADRLEEKYHAPLPHRTKTQLLLSGLILPIPILGIIFAWGVWGPATPIVIAAACLVSFLVFNKPYRIYTQRRFKIC